MLAAAGTIVLATTGLLALSLSIRGSLLELASKKATLPKQPSLLPHKSCWRRGLLCRKNLTDSRAKVLQEEEEKEVFETDPKGYYTMVEEV